MSENGKVAHTAVMKKIYAKSAAFLGAILLSFTLPKAAELGSLKSVSAPYACCYDCKTLTIDGVEYLDHFSLLRLELKGEGELLFTCVDKSGRREQKTAQYEYDEEEKKLVLLFEREGKRMRYAAAMREGEIIFTVQLKGRLLLAVFSSE